jgi:hypothetical protein
MMCNEIPRIVMATGVRAPAVNQPCTPVTHPSLADCVFVDFVGSDIVVVGDADASASFVNCKFENNELRDAEGQHDRYHAIIDGMKAVCDTHSCGSSGRVVVRYQTGNNLVGVEKSEIKNIIKLFLGKKVRNVEAFALPLTQ